MARRWHKTTAGTAHRDADTFAQRIAAEIDAFTRIKAALVEKTAHLAGDPHNMRLQAEHNHVTMQLYRAQGAILAWVAAFTLACPDAHEGHALAAQAVRLAGVDFPMPTVNEALALMRAFLEGDTEGGV